MGMIEDVLVELENYPDRDDADDAEAGRDERR
jgi:hypothetical protein